MTIFYTAPGFDAGRVSHGFFGRRGGVSTGVFESLNAGYDTDDPGVDQNRDIIARALGGLDRGDIASVYQVHSADCVFVDRVVPLDQRPRVDAMVTDRPGIILGVLTADCGPILYHGIKKNGDPVIGAAHAGWRGALSGVLENTVRCMTDQGAQLASIVAAVGPCIAQGAYEVSPDFLEPFLDYDPADERFFRECHPGQAPKGREPGPSVKETDEGPGSLRLRPSSFGGIARDDIVTKYLFDLPGYIARRLAACGVRRVILSDIDTYSRPDEYFSYRRATHQKDGENGRQMSCIRIYGD